MRDVMIIKNICAYSVLTLFAASCIASDGDFDDVMYRIKTGEFIVQLEQEKQEKILMDYFTLSICKKDPIINIIEYDYWRESIYDAILARYDNFTQLLAIHIEHNNFVQSIINTISYFPHMKEPLIQLGEQLPVLKKYMSKDLFVQLNGDM